MTVYYQTLSPDVILRYQTSKSLEKKILKIIRSLDPKKAHSWDDILIKIVKLCDVEIVGPLYLIYKKCLDTGRFPISWKKGNVLPIHKKGNRQLKKNYRPISLLPVCGKIFEKLILDAIYEYLCENQVLTPSQSGFRPGDSTVNHPLQSRIRYIMLLKNSLREKQELYF